MAPASALRNFIPVRMMIVGYPGTAKTGGLAPLVDAGFKLRILDYDGNLDPLYEYVKDKDKLDKNVDALHFEDPLKVSRSFTMTSEIPRAFELGLHAMDRWRYYSDNYEFVDPSKKVDEKRPITDLGASKDWGPDTIVVLDTLTRQGEAAFDRAMAILGKTPANMTIQGQMLAQHEQLKFIRKLNSKVHRFHVIVLAHLKTISPKDIIKDDSPLTKELKQRIADIVPTKLFPRALGQELPQQIGGEFTTLIKAESRVLAGGRVKRIIKTRPEPFLDLKVPATVPDVLDISDGVLQIFNAISPASVEAVAGRGTIPPPVPLEEETSV